MTAAWKETWKSHLEGRIDTSKVVKAAIDEFRIILERNLAMQEQLRFKADPLDTNERMLDFCKRARKDLIALTESGANPPILLRLIHKGAIRERREPGENDERKQSEFEAIAKPVYWKKKVLRLESAEEALGEFMASDVYREIEEWQLSSALELKIYPFARLCKEVKATRRSLGRLLGHIRKLRLDTGDRKLTYAPPYVSWEPTEAKRGPKARGGKNLDWDQPGYGLWKYLTKRTGHAHLRRIARLLHFAGWNFPGVVTVEDSLDVDTERVDQDEVDKLNKRVKKLSRDPRITIQVGDSITALEDRYETRDLLDYGGFLMSPLAVIPRGDLSNE